MVGCSGDRASDSVGEDEVLESQSEARRAPSDFFSEFRYESSSGASHVERYVDCGVDQVLTGAGARVDGNGHVTDVTIHCRDILSDGALSANAYSVQAGGASQEKVIQATLGYVIVGLGATVADANLQRLVIKQCPWIASDRRVDVSACDYTSTTPGSDSSDVFLDAHLAYSTSERSRVVATGFGLTATRDQVLTIRMSSGKLVPSEKDGGTE